MKLETIELTFNYKNEHGQDVQIRASVDAEYGYRQWGAALTELGENVDLIDAITNAAYESGKFEEPEPVEEEA